MSTRSPWPFAILGLLGMNVVIVGITVFYAASDRSLAIEPNYYQKALAWDRSQIQGARNAHLGWTTGFSLERASDGAARIGVVLRDRGGAAIDEARVTVVAFHNSRASDRSSVSLAAGGEGRYAGEIVAARDGLWHFQFTAVRGTETFTEVVERTLAPMKKGGTP